MTGEGESSQHVEGEPPVCAPLQVLALLLRRKTSLLNHRVFQLILSIAGTAELGFGSSAVTNVGVFQHILCNFEVKWRWGLSPKEVCTGRRSQELSLNPAGRLPPWP